MCRVRRARENGVGRAMPRHVDHLMAGKIMALKSNGKAPKEIASIHRVSIWAVYRTIQRNVSCETKTPNAKNIVCHKCGCSIKM